MKLADKSAYPTSFQTGLTFRERLIVALASNPSLTDGLTYEKDANQIIKCADAIISKLESEAKNER